MPPLKIPRKFYGVEEYLVQCLSKPKRAKVKTIYTYETREKKLATHSKEVKEAQWLFPHISSTTARRICKEVLGPEFYAHYLRLRKLSKIGMNREKGSITYLKAVSGIKSVRALEAYIGYDEQAQDEAMEISE